MPQDVEGCGYVGGLAIRRVGRSPPDLVRIVAELERDGIGFENLTEKIETNSANGKLTRRAPAFNR